MKTLTDHLTQYAAYHMDHRNVATHFVGIPMIVLAVTTLLSRLSLDVGGLPLTPALIVAALSSIFYLRLDLRFGLAMVAQLVLSLWISQWIAAQSTAVWLSWGIGLFVVGWIIQFIGHYWEGRKPAFVDDLVGLLVGPLFLTAEVAFALKMRQDVYAEIQRRLGEGAHGARRRVAAA
ncbi:MAG: DUF962 domain-containing protein [Burkholderiaceae bacterium]|nr:DUF962 domain-containing protein [Burkholderiaceae bacterium]